MGRTATPTRMALPSSQRRWACSLQAISWLPTSTVLRLLVREPRWSRSTQQRALQRSSTRTLTSRGLSASQSTHPRTSFGSPTTDRHLMGHPQGTQLSPTREILWPTIPTPRARTTVTIRFLRAPGEPRLLQAPSSGPMLALPIRQLEARPAKYGD